MLVSALVLGLIAGVVTGGDLRRLARVRIRALPLLLAAGALRVIGLFFALPVLVYTVVLALLVIVALLNRHVPGALLATVGIALNLVVIALNGGMPVDAVAAQSVGVELKDDGLHIPLSSATVLPFLADVIPAHVFRNLYSVGDIVLAGSGFWIVFRLLRRPH